MLTSFTVLYSLTLVPVWVWGTVTTALYTILGEGLIKRKPHFSAIWQSIAHIGSNMGFPSLILLQVRAILVKSYGLLKHICFYSKKSNLTSYVSRAFNVTNMSQTKFQLRKIHLRTFKAQFIFYSKNLNWPRTLIVFLMSPTCHELSMSFEKSTPVLLATVLFHEYLGSIVQIQPCTSTGKV